MSDPVLDAYVKKYGERPQGCYEWDDDLALWRSAWKEATLIEREAAAKVCEARVPPDARHGTTDVEDESRNCADAIRARTKP